MFRQIVVVLATLTFALGILFTSVFRTASVRYVFSETPNTSFQEGQGVVLGESIEIDYYFRYPGRILPDHPLWFLKALRDRVWLLLTTNPSRKAELKLLFADKRVVSAKILFERGKPELGVSTLTKAEKYLEEACNLEKENREKGLDTSEFLSTLAKASLKHRQTIDEILKLAPEEAKPIVIRAQDYSKETYNKTRDALHEKGLPVPENPYDTD